MTTWQDNLAARQTAAIFSATRGFSQPATIVSGGTTTADVQVVVRPRAEQPALTDSGEMTRISATVQIDRSGGLTLSRSRAGYYGALTLADGTAYSIISVFAESSTMYVVSAATSTTTQQGVSRGRQ